MAQDDAGGVFWNPSDGSAARWNDGNMKGGKPRRKLRLSAFGVLMDNLGIDDDQRVYIVFVVFAIVIYLNRRALASAFRPTRRRAE